MAELKMGKDGLPLVKEEAAESPWWLPLLGIFVVLVGMGWVAWKLQPAEAQPATVTVEIAAPEVPAE